MINVSQPKIAENTLPSIHNNLELAMINVSQLKIGENALPSIYNNL